MSLEETATDGIAALKVDDRGQARQSLACVRSQLRESVKGDWEPAELELGSLLCWEVGKSIWQHPEDWEEGDLMTSSSAWWTVVEIAELQETTFLQYNASRALTSLGQLYQTAGVTGEEVGDLFELAHRMGKESGTQGGYAWAARAVLAKSKVTAGTGMDELWEAITLGSRSGLEWGRETAEEASRLIDSKREEEMDSPHEVPRNLRESPRKCPSCGARGFRRTCRKPDCSFSYYPP